MKRIYRMKCIMFCAVVALAGGCNIAGLEFQDDAPYDYHVLDPQTGMSAWEFLNLPRKDTIFELMQAGIAYAGLEEEYKKPNRTFLFLRNDAILRYNPNGTVNTGSYFGYNKLDDGSAATKWQDYPVEEVRAFLQYHILEGVYTFGQNLEPENVEVATLSGETAFIRAGNERNSPVRVNDYPFAIRPASAHSSNIQTTNGVIHVLNGFTLPGDDLSGG
jgi:uncharacterized surface protein with fasciclin (FAS1) repeats